MTGSGGGTKYINLMLDKSNINYIYKKISYSVYILQNKDLLCSQAYKYKCLYDFVVHNQHWLHSCKDQHIFHFDKLELLGIQDQSNTHMVCILCRDFLYAQVDIGTLQNDYLLCKMP